MDFGGFNWSLVTIVGPLVLLAVIAWAVLRNRVSRRRGSESEAATHRLYEEEEVARRREDGDGP